MLIEVSKKITGKISNKNYIKGTLNSNNIKIYPELEDLEVTPSKIEQNFKSKKYGYGNVKVKAVEKIIDFVITDGSYLCYNGARQDVAQQLLNLLYKPTDMQHAFYDCREIIDLDFSNIDASNIVSLSNMLYNCKKIVNLNFKNFNTLKCTNMSGLFSGCEKITNLDLSSFNTSNVTSTSYMFAYCYVLTELDLSSFNTSNVTGMSNMFYECRKLTNVNLKSFNTSNVTNMSNMFYRCYELDNLNLSNFDMSNITNISYMFKNCFILKNLQSFKNLGKGYTQKTNNYSYYKLDLSDSKDLTHDSLMDVINNLYDLNLSYDVANGGTLYTQNLTLGSTNLAKLTNEEIAIATNKGWNVT